MTPAERGNSDDAEPRKAYLVKWKIVNEAECIVYADSVKDALARFDAGEGEDRQTTGEDYRLGRPKAKRWPREDPDA